MAQYDKNYSPSAWKDKPSTDTSLNAYRLNKMENGINTADNRVVALSHDKLEVSEANLMVQNVTMDTATGVMTVTLKNGTQTTYDLDIEKVVTNFDLDADNNLVLTLADGTAKTVSLASLVDTYTFTSSTTISFTTTGKNITAIIPDGAVTLAKLEATVISTIRQYTLDAQTAKGQAEQAAATAQGYAIGGEGFEGTNAQLFAGQSKRYAVITDEAPTDNAQYYSQQAAASAAVAEHIVGFDGTAGTITATDTHGLGSANVQGQLDALAAPVFDTSGTAPDIASFPDFIDRITSGMRILDFFRNLKAGLKFVLHTGQLVNNGLCNTPGKYPLDAAYGKILVDMIGNVSELPGGAADVVAAIVKQNSDLDALIKTESRTIAMPATQPGHMIAKSIPYTPPAGYTVAGVFVYTFSGCISDGYCSESGYLSGTLYNPTDATRTVEIVFKILLLRAV